MEPLDLSLLFNLGHWFDGNPGFPSVYYYVIAGIYVIGLAASVYLYFVYAKGRFREHRFKRRMSGSVSTWAGVLALVALAFLGARYAGIPILSARIFLYLAIVASLGSLTYLLFYWFRLFPGELARYEDMVLRSRYSPKPKGKPTGGPPPSVKRKKKGKKAK
ncbi:MAG: hypothetical protein ABIH46_05155 [Chloroflexota bacterium]